LFGGGVAHGPELLKQPHRGKCALLVTLLDIRFELIQLRTARWSLKWLRLGLPQDASHGVATMTGQPRNGFDGMTGIV
jgi:hypothetical protein